MKVATPTPPPTPTVPYVVVTTYAVPRCQGVFSEAINFVIGACTAVPGTAVYGIASLTGTVRRRHDECALYASLLPLVASYSCSRARAKNQCRLMIMTL